MRGDGYWRKLPGNATLGEWGGCIVIALEREQLLDERDGSWPVERKEN